MRAFGPARISRVSSATVIFSNPIFHGFSRIGMPPIRGNQFDVNSLVALLFGAAIEDD
jgi:hypothetical protein